MTAVVAEPIVELHALLAHIRPSANVFVFGGDVFVPVVMSSPSQLDAELLDEGLLAKRTVLREVGEQGDVNRVLISNYSSRNLLLVDGEQIVGAKQNRVFNASFLIAPGAHDVEVPVSCVERGRWAYQSREFTGSDTTLTSTARSKKLSRVARSVMAGDGYDAKQRAVWDDVDDYLDRSRVISRTSAFEDAVKSRTDITLTGLERLVPTADQVGIALVRDGKLALMDVFGSAILYRRCHRKIAAGMLSDPSAGTAQTDGASDVVAGALRELRRMSPTRRAAPSIGETHHAEIRSEDVTLSMGAIAHDGHLYHMVVGAA